jgi:uncharacterized membrane protein (UPF0127 family)
MRPNHPTWADPDVPYLLNVNNATRKESLWVASGGPARRTGLLGTDGLDGLLWIERCSSVHTVGMRYAIDVAYLTRTGRVLDVVTMRPGRVGFPRLRARSVLEAPAGVMARLGVRPGVVVGRSAASS